MANNKFLYISALISFSVYFTLLGLLLFYINTSNVKKFDSFQKNTVLELDVLIEDKKPDLAIKTAIKVTTNNTDLSEKIVKKSKSTSVKQKSDLKSLFANVETKSNVVKEKDINNIQKSTITSRFKAKFEKQRESTNEALSKLMIKSNDAQTKEKATDSSNEHDPYISKIYDMLFQRWTPLLIIDGLSATVIVSIDSEGHFSYRLLQYSGNATFDNQLLSFLDQQATQLFPAPEDKNQINIEVIFTAKAK